MYFYLGILKNIIDADSSFLDNRLGFYLYSFIHSPISAMQRALISCLESLKPKESVNFHVHFYVQPPSRFKDKSNYYTA